MNNRIKKLITVASIVVLLGGNFFLAGWLIKSRIDNSYWEGVQNATLFTACRKFTPYVSDMVVLRNTNVADCKDIFLLTDNDKPIGNEEYPIALELEK